jgi:hypothetical protein
MGGKKGRRGPSPLKGRRHHPSSGGGVIRCIYDTAGGIAKGCLVLCTVAGTLVGTVQGGKFCLRNPSLVVIFAASSQGRAILERRRE